MEKMDNILLERREKIEKVGVLYILRNNINNKCYVGQTVRSFKSRLGRHLRSKVKTPIDLALEKYGINQFSQYVFESITENLLDYFEIEMIKKLNSLSPNGYNLESGGNKNKHLHEEHKKKISASLKGKTFAEERKTNISNSLKGRKLSKEHVEKIIKSHNSVEVKEKLSKSMKGKKHSLATKKKMSGNKKGKNNPMYGKSFYDVWVIKYGEEEAVIKEQNRRIKLSNRNSQC